MISRAIKGWLQKVFAWWPWMNTPESSYTHPVSSINKSIVQDASMYTTVDGTVSQPGPSSVAVEHSEDEEIFTELSWAIPDSDEHPEPFTPLSLVVEEQSDITLPPSSEPNQHDTLTRDLSTISIPTPTPAQKLEFLRYLVQRGHVNEGFDRGYEPEQYRKNR